MIEFAFPWAFLGVLLPFFIAYILPKLKTELAVAVTVPFFNPLLNFAHQQKISINRLKQEKIFFLVWCLLLFALSGPRWVGAPQSLEREGHNIMMILDLSGSMALNDMRLNGRPAPRLMVVKQAANQFIRERQGDRIGLILFGTRAYLQTPLTYDHRSVLVRLEDATVGLAGQTTSIGDALGLAIKRLQKVPPEGRVAILLTDGANNSGVVSPLKAAELAKLEGVKVYTIGLSAEESQQGFRNLMFNPNMGTDLDEESLKKIAEMTEGRYFRATDTNSLHQIYKTINELETLPQEEATIRPQKEYYPWPLALACLLLFYWIITKPRALPQ